MNPQIRIVHGGPMLVEDLILTSLARRPDGTPVTEPVEPALGRSYALCRCGASNSMPLCDREPPYECFQEEAPSGPTPAPYTWDVPDPGVPAIALKPNGPIRVAGSVPVAVDDQPIPPFDRTSLCRCGASRCQPLCDGSHKVVGFRSDAPRRGNPPNRPV